MNRRTAKRWLAGAAAASILLSARIAMAIGTPTAMPGATQSRGMTGVTTDSAGLAGPALRMIVSLAAVLALVGALAWVAKKLRNGNRARGGLIEILSGVSLGTRDKVVLLRVGEEQVLVGVSPAGMRALHVLREGAPRESFKSHMERQNP
jgi:flagellar protein FliO/FliZ